LTKVTGRLASSPSTARVIGDIVHFSHGKPSKHWVSPVRQFNCNNES